MALRIQYTFGNHYCPVEIPASVEHTSFIAGQFDDRGLGTHNSDYTIMF